jgi:glycosyltransferase involved in cell wall biosynthesis
VKPFVSCLCPTYNRAPAHLHLVAEAVESFRRQTYPDCELVILNDTPGQELTCDVPGVRVVNLGARIATLGQKRDALVRMARGELLLPWDDDDISLPGRIAQAVERLGLAPYWNPRRHWWLNNDRLSADHAHGVGHNSSIFTRQAWERVGGYPAESGSEDASMDTRLLTLGEPPPRLSDDPAGWQYVYRWGVSDRHLSGVAGGPLSDPHRPQWEAIGRRPIVAGRFVIEPAWKEDYAARCDAFLAGLGTVRE